RGRYRVAGNAVKLIDESATKLSYGSKGVRLATSVFNECRASNIHMDVAGLISPGMRILGRLQFCDELVKSGVAIAHAGAITKHCVEGRGIAVIQQPDFLVTLNCAGTRGQTQQSKRGHRSPDHCLKIRLSLHPKNLLVSGRLES